MQSKVTIVGAGRVGAAAAAWLVAPGHDVVLVDQDARIAEGAALDLSHAAWIQGSSTVVATTHYEPTEGSDVVVITAGAARRSESNRDELLERNRSVVAGIAAEAGARSPEAVFVVVTNPVEPLCQLVLDVVGDQRRVLGLGGVLDTSRFALALALEAGVQVSDVQDALVLGRHGEAMVPIISHTKISAVPLRELMSDGQIEAVVERTRFASQEVLSLVGATCWAPSAAIAAMVNAILLPHDAVLPCAAFCDGQYGVDGFIGVPVRLGRRGVEEIVELELAANELDALRSAANEVRRLS